MSSTSEAGTSTDDNIYLQGPLCLFYFECPFAILSATPPRRIVMPHYWREQPPYYDARYHDDAPYDNHTGYHANGQHHQDNSGGYHNGTAYHNGTGYHDNGTYPKESYNERFYNGFVNSYQNGFDDDSSCQEPTLKPTDLFLPTGMPFNPEKKLNFNTYTKLSYDLGQAKVHRKPLTLSPFPARPCFKYPDTTWLDSSTPSYVLSKKRKNKKKLPPLELPSPKEYEDLSTDLSTDWLSDFKTNTRISLPPISIAENIIKDNSVVGAREKQCVRLSRVGVRKKKSQLSGIRRTIVALMQRKLNRKNGGTAGLTRVLRLVKRPAWSDSRLIKSSSSSLVRSSLCERVSDGPASKSERDTTCARRLAAMFDASVGAGSRRRIDASRGLLHRRYSMPETVMRKYHLAQASPECDELSVQTCPSPAGSGGSFLAHSVGHHRFHDMQDMRKSALTRKWRLPTSSSPQPRSLDGSINDLRPKSRRHSPAKSIRKHLCEHLTHSTGRSHDQLNSYMESSSEALQTETDTKSNESSSDVNDSITKSSINNLEANELSSSVNNGLCNVTSNKTEQTITHDKSSLLMLTSTSDTPIETVPSNKFESNSITDTSDTLTSSIPTAKEITKTRQTCKAPSKPQNYEVRIDQFTNEYDNNIVPYFESVQEYPKYEMLEIVVSETINQAFGDQISPEEKFGCPEKLGKQIIRNMKCKGKTSHNVGIDEYVSNILVESLNSLTDQIESMNACIGNDQKISIIEKEIKVKLQNTGMNTIVHLSPTSNNPIIFGNEELYHNDENNDSFNNNINIANVLLIREETASAESNNNSVITSETCQLKSPFTIDVDQPNASLSNSLHHETVNHAVLQQIQKLFQDEFRSLDPDFTKSFPSQFEISNVDNYAGENELKFEKKDTIEVHTQSYSPDTKSIVNENLLGIVGAGNYSDVSETFIVPRYNAIPHTTSMEVNTSSSESDQIASECTSLVDSLDDPNSPRYLLTKNCKEHNLVRSAIDILSLLPESDRNESGESVREKGESFYIRIKDNQCDCEKENVVVADHMPEKIKERLFNRHKRREMRIECARYKKSKQLKREIERQQYQSYIKSQKKNDSDCMSIVNLLLDEVIYKIAQDEYKHMNIKDKKKTKTKKSHDNHTKPLRKSTESLHNLSIECNKGIKNVSSQFSKSEGNLKNYTDKPHIKGKLSLQPHTPSHKDASPKRIYQKSEIHEGDKCIEILEILEYSDRSQSSPETNSDENQYHSFSKRKSKIPIPVHERLKNSSKFNISKHQTNFEPRQPSSNNDLISVESQNSDSEPNNPVTKGLDSGFLRQNQRKSLKHSPESRSCLNSVKFKRIYEIIPEENQVGNFETTNDNFNSKRRPSAPTQQCFREINDSILNTPTSLNNTIHNKGEKKSYRHTGTSPAPFEAQNQVKKDCYDRQRLKNDMELKNTIISPLGRNINVSSTPRRPPTDSRDNGFEQVDRKDTKSASTQYENSLSSDRNSESRQIDDIKKNKPELSIGDIKKGSPVKDMTCPKVVTKKKVRKLDEKRLAKKKIEVENEKRRLCLANEIRSMSDPQLNQIALKKRERRKGTEQMVARRGDVSMSSSGESGSLLCCGGRGRDSGEKSNGEAQAATQTEDVTPSSAWSVTVGGAGGGGLLPQQLQMRLSFAPPLGKPQPITSALPPVTLPSTTHIPNKSIHSAVALPPPLVLPPTDNNTQPCSCRHCAECSCPQSNYQGSLKGVLPGMSPPTRRASQAHSPPRALKNTGCSEWLCVRGAGVLPVRKPRAPNASERDVTRRRVRVRARQTDTSLASTMLHAAHWR